jgi:hypothetical protein
MDFSKIEPYRISLERYVQNATEAYHIDSYRSNLSHMLKIGLVAIDIPGGGISKYNPETCESTNLVEAYSFRSAGLEEESDLGEVYDERDYPIAYAWITGTAHSPLHLEREKLDKDSAEYHEFVEYGFYNAIYFPIIVENKFWGYVEIWENRYPRPFNADEVKLLEGIVFFIAQAITANEPSKLLET